MSEEVAADNAPQYVRREEYDRLRAQVAELREALQRLLIDLEDGRHYSVIATQIGDILAKTEDDLPTAADVRGIMKP